MNWHIGLHLVSKLQNQGISRRRLSGGALWQYHRPERLGQLWGFEPMGRPRKQRRKTHGSAWHWKQTDCWYYTLPGTKKRMPLFAESGERIRGRNQQPIAEQALARLQLSGELNGPGPVAAGDWIVARV